MTSTVRPDVSAFFQQYGQAGNVLDIGVLTECFFDTFLNLDPNVATPVKREVLIAALPMREKLFGSIGAEGLDLTHLRETPLDEMHTLVRTTWAVRFAPDIGATPLSLDATFLLRRADGGEWRIVMYLNHHDVQATIREHIALPADRNADLFTQLKPLREPRE
ncbi:MAG TPA: hypothetical protein VK662_09725 [Acidothermaceae bacterium]|jgi:hypothetical protein|nr:hypothetical protein [Acidothermaceae bacterium]